MSAIIEEYKQISQSFINYIAVFKLDVDKYALKAKADQFWIDKNSKKLEELYTIKKRFDFLFQSMLLIDSDTYETGRTAGIKEAQKEFGKIENPYDVMLPSERDKWREVHILKCKEIWPELYL